MSDQDEYLWPIARSLCGIRKRETSRREFEDDAIKATAISIRTSDPTMKIMLIGMLSNLEF